MRRLDELRELRRRVAELEAALPFEGRTLRQSPKHGPYCNGQDYCGCPDRKEKPGPDADLVCSDIYEGVHKPVIDIDLPCRLVESSPGRFHLYIDTRVDHVEYFDMLAAMAKAGVVEDGYVFASKMRGYSAVRHPEKLKADAPRLKCGAAYRVRPGETWICGEPASHPGAHRIGSREWS